jgi:hypothetical protein
MKAMQIRRHANELMRDGLPFDDPDEPIPFFCECGDSHCLQVVWLTASEYRERRAEATGFLVADSHGGERGADSSRRCERTFARR